MHIFYTPCNEDMANGTLLCGDPVLVCEKRIQLPVQAVTLMGKSVKTWRKKELRTQLCLIFVTWSAAFISGYPAYTKTKLADGFIYYYAFPRTMEPN